MNTIPYHKIDIEMVDLIKLFNQNDRFKTKYCCFGHSEKDHFYIMLDDSVSFHDFEEFATMIAEEFPNSQVFCRYWIRKTSKILRNWIIETNEKKNIEERIKIKESLINIISKVDTEI